MSIASRMAGQSVLCATCGEQTPVPLDESASPDSASADAEHDVFGSAAEQDEIDEFEDEFEVNADQADHSDALDEADEHDAAADKAAAIGSADEDDDAQPERPAVAVAPPAGDDEDEDYGPLMRSAETDFEDTDLTPMVDVTFLLLIFFMITASFSLHKTIQVPTPDPEEQGATQSIQKIEDLLDDSIKVEIDARDVISIDDEPLTDPDALVDTLRSKMRSDQKVELAIRAAEGARHGTVVSVVDAGNAVGMQAIRMILTAAPDGT